jgi:hypothetical protein
MAKEGIEPQTSRILGNHLNDCAIANVMKTYPLSNYEFSTR